jgi:hypothetical protein
MGEVPGATCAFACDKKEKLSKNPPPLRAEAFRKSLRFRFEGFFMARGLSRG